ncbi:MAG: hypothetical protein ACRCX2_20825 [Paraclostridium sp.]
MRGMLDKLSNDAIWLIKKLGYEEYTNVKICNTLIKEFDETVIEFDATLVTKVVMEVLSAVNDTYFTNKFIEQLYNNKSLCSNIFLYELLMNAEYNKKYYSIKYFKHKITEVYDGLSHIDDFYDETNLEVINQTLKTAFCKPTIDFIMHEYSGEELDYIGVLHDDIDDDFRGRFIDDSIDKVITYTTLVDIMFKDNMSDKIRCTDVILKDRLTKELKRLTDSLSILDGCVVYLNTIVFKEPLINMDSDDISLDEDINKSLLKFIKETNTFYKDMVDQNIFDLDNIIEATQTNFRRISDKLTDKLEVELLSCTHINDEDDDIMNEDIYTLESFMQDVSSIVKHHMGLVSCLRCLITLTTTEFEKDEDAIVTIQSVMTVIGFISAILGIPDRSTIYPSIKIRKIPLLRYMEDKINEWDD